MYNKELWKSKVFWTSIAGICTAVGGYVAGEIDLPATVGVVLTLLLAIEFRDTIRE